MSTPRCPHCQVILTDVEAAAVLCPVCAAALRDDPPAAKPTSKRWLLVSLVCLAIVALAVVAWRAWPPADDQNEYEPLPAPGRLARDTSSLAPGTHELPAPHVEVVHEVVAELLTAPHVEREAVARAETLPAPLVEQEAPLVKAKRPVNNAVANTHKFNCPDDDVSIEQATEDSKLILTGRVRTLILKDVNAAAVVDASKLHAKRVIVRGMIDNSATVLLEGDHVEFEKSINGDAEVTVDASGGKVIFANEVIAGSCRLVVKARDVEFRGPIEGGVKVLVTLTSGGSLAFASTDGGAVLEYRKASALDPALKILEGQVKGGSRFGEKKQ